MNEEISCRRIGCHKGISVFRASCSADQGNSFGSLTLSHSEHPGEIQASQDSIVNQDYHLTDVSARISRHINCHQHLGHLVAPTDANLSAVLLCHTVNIPARYKHHKIALSIRHTTVTHVLARISQQTNYPMITCVSASYRHLSNDW